MTFEGAQRARGYHEQRAKGPGEQCLKKKRQCEWRDRKYKKESNRNFGAEKVP